MKNTDLHTHSIYSDGNLSPSEVVRRAKRNGIRYLALTDHNSVDGIEEAIKEGEKIGVEIIPAIEIVAKEDEVLGYFIDYKNKKLTHKITEMQKEHAERVKKIISKMKNENISVNLAEVLDFYKPNKNLMKIHLIKYLSHLGYGDVRDLYKKYGEPGTKTYVKTTRETPVLEAILLVKYCGGVPVLAHPWVSADSKKLLKEKNFKKLVDAGLRGIEIDNGDRDERRDERILQEIRGLAKKYKLIVTSGSDFHGEYLIGKSGNHEIGNHNCDEKIIEQLREAK